MNFWKKIVSMITIGLTFYLLFLFFFPSLPEQSKIPHVNTRLGNTNRVLMKGLRINESLGDRPFFSAEIKRVRFEHTKVGFLRFGMFPVAVIEGFKLTVFDSRAGNSQPLPDTDKTGQVNNSNLPLPQKNPYFPNSRVRAHSTRKESPSDQLYILKEVEKYVSDAEFLKLFKLDRAYNIRFKPVHFKIVRNDKEILRITCQLLEPDIAKNRLRLSGNVSIHAENKKVEGESFSFDWKRNRLFSDKEYKYKTINDEHAVMRQKLDTDIFLTSL